MNHFIAPLLLWIGLNFIIAFQLKGAGFFVIPAYSGLIMLSYFVVTQKSNRLLNLLLTIPTILIIVPFIPMFPIGLGLKLLFGSALLVVFCFVLLLPIFGTYSRKMAWAVVLFAVSIGFFVQAHIHSDYQNFKAKPNSLVYVLDTDTHQAVWATYDTHLDEWTKLYLTEKPNSGSVLNQFSLYSKYNSSFTFTKKAPIIEVKKPIIEFLTDSTVGRQRYLKIKITPTRKVNRYDIFANSNLVFQDLKANGTTVLKAKKTKEDTKNAIVVTYYVVDNEPLVMEFNVFSTAVLDMEMLESSFDLLENPLFGIKKRAPWMMPTPFVLNDAIIIKQKIKPGTPPVSSAAVAPKKKLPNVPTNDTLQHTNGKN
jgi:hypothetical protein